MATSAVYSDEPTVGNVVLGPQKLLQESFTDNITALGANQGTAVQLVSEMNRITSAAAGTGVILPPSKSGLTIFVVHRGANNLQVYGAGADVIDVAAGSVGVTQMVNSTVLYVCHTPGTWETEGLSTGFDPTLGLQTLSFAVIAASATDTQVGGTPIKTLMVHVTSSGSGQACTLPAALPGLQITVASATAANTLDIFPASGDAINALGANTKITMAALTSAVFMCAIAGQWFTVPRVPS